MVMMETQDGTQWGWLHITKRQTFFNACLQVMRKTSGMSSRGIERGWELSWIKQEEQRHTRRWGNENQSNCFRNGLSIHIVGRFYSKREYIMFILYLRVRILHVRTRLRLLKIFLHLCLFFFPFWTLIVRPWGDNGQWIRNKRWMRNGQLNCTIYGNWFMDFENSIEQSIIIILDELMVAFIFFLSLM